MNLDLQAAWRQGRWTAYGTVGREPARGGAGPISCEHWVAYQASDGVSVRGGRFLPAYGVRFADHTSFTRGGLDLAQDDQVYGVEVGVSTDRTLLQVSVGPGRAESLVDDDGRQALTSAGRLQLDLGPRMVLAASALYRGASDITPRSTNTGLSFGYSPASWLTTWTHADVGFQRLRASSRSYIFANQTSVEAFRGLWLRISPQRRWTDTDPRGEIAAGCTVWKLLRSKRLRDLSVALGVSLARNSYGASALPRWLAHTLVGAPAPSDVVAIFSRTLSASPVTASRWSYRPRLISSSPRTSTVAS